MGGAMNEIDPPRVKGLNPQVSGNRRDLKEGKRVMSIGSTN